MFPQDTISTATATATVTVTATEGRLPKHARSVARHLLPIDPTLDTATIPAKTRQKSAAVEQEVDDRCPPPISGGTYRNENRQLVTQKRCAVCSAEFEAKRPHAKYCKPSCKMKAYRKRQKGRCLQEQGK